MSNNSIICAGIDIGKRKLDVAVCGAKASLQIDNTSAGHEKLVTWLQRHKVERVGVEATGGYEQGVVRALRREGIPVMVFQPIHVLYKTRLETARDEYSRAFWKGEIAGRKAQLRGTLKTLRTDMRAHADLAAKLDLITSVEGIAEKTAIAILIRMPEIGTLSREQVAALAGLAPYDDDSGRRVGSRRIQGGRSRLRSCLYAAALPAAFFWNPQLVTFYKRLRANGKTHKMALVACARKLLIFVNTVVARATPWQPKPAAT